MPMRREWPSIQTREQDFITDPDESGLFKIMETAAACQHIERQCGLRYIQAEKEGGFYA